MVSYRLITTVCLLLWWTNLPGTALADLVVNISSGEVAPGGTVILDVTVTAKTGTTENLHLFEGGFRIFPLDSGNPMPFPLQFVDPDSENFLQQANYVFDGVSFVTNPNNVGEVATDADTEDFTLDQLNYLDKAVVANGNDPTFVTITDASSYLLAQLEINYVLPMGATEGDFEGDVYQIGFEPIFGPSALNVDFQDISVDPVTPGTITIATAVPEPSTWIALATASGILAYRRRRKSGQKVE